MSAQSFPLTPCQLHLWKSQVITPDKPLFNQVVTIRLPAHDVNERDIVSLCEAWQQVQRQIPVLASAIVSGLDDLPQQQLGVALSAMQVIDLAAPPGEFDSYLKSWVDERKKTPLRLDKALSDAALLTSHGQDLVIYLNMHHLIADAWSTTLVCQALLAQYSRQAKKILELPALEDMISQEWSFRDYAEHVSKAGNTQSATADTGNPRSVSSDKLPSFYGRVNRRPDTCSARHALLFTDADRQAMESLAGDAELRLLNRNLFQMCFHLCALTIYIHKVTGDSEIIIDAPLLGRFEQRWFKVVGNFIEMVRLTLVVSEEHSILDLYQHIREVLFDALKNASPGCTASLPAGAAHAVLNVITASLNTGSTEQLRLDWHHPGHSDSHHPLRLHVVDWQGGGPGNIDLDINHAYFDSGHTDRVLSHLLHAYRVIFAHRQRRLRDISLLDHDEQWCFSGHSNAVAKVPVDLLTVQFQAVAREHPERIAISDDKQSMSYAEVDALSRQLAVQLNQAGIGSDQRVAVYLPRSVQLPVVLLGILVSGAAYVPIDVNQPPQRIAEVLSDSAVALLIAESADKLPVNTNVTVWAAAELLAGRQRALAHLSDDSTAPKAVDPAYIIYTSGSTGKPKGVVISHAALAAYLTWARHYYSLDQPVVMPLFTSIGFDLTVTSLYLPLLSGGTVRVFEQGQDSQALTLFDVVSDDTVNTIKLTPAHLNLLHDEVTPGKAIEQLIVGGEDLKCETARRTAAWMDKPVSIINEYGPTEATVGCIVRRWQPGEVQGSVPIGLPISGMFAYVLNSALQAQFEGMPGELYLGGASLAEGYWNDERLTANAFIENPWQAGDRLYRTGDLVRVENNELVYLGRTDTQIKINGNRIELSEIENALAGHPDVQDCVVLGPSLGPSDRHTPSEQNMSEQYERVQERHCVECGLSSRFPETHLNRDGICSLCVDYKPNQARINEYFKSTDELRALIKTIQAGRVGDYDALVLLSGGKDSTYALAKLVDLGLRVYAFSLDNGYISEQAKENIDTVCSALQVPHYYASTPHMNDIFRDSLDRYSNVCHGCFKSIYTLALAFAAEHSINYIFTGLSRGQLFETRLNNELFAENTLPVQNIDSMVQAARLQYHAVKDAPYSLLNIKAVNDGTLARRIAIVDFYRYCHVELSDMLTYLKQRVGWVRPADTGRSTNCLINDVGIHVHKLEQGFHNYSLPYSWDVRLGHKQRDDALEELDDEIDLNHVDTILKSIDYVPKSPGTQSQSLRAWYRASQPLDEPQLREWLYQRLPDYMMPKVLIWMADMPLNAHGKVDRKALTRLGYDSERATDTGRLPDSPAGVILADVWKEQLRLNTIYLHHDFFKLGGDSLAAIRCVMELRRRGFAVEPADLFRQSRFELFLQLLETDTPQAVNQPLQKPEKFSSLGSAQQDKLRAALNKRISK